jgi:hypothetical protein
VKFIWFGVLARSNFASEEVQPWKSSVSFETENGPIRSSSAPLDDDKDTASAGQKSPGRMWDSVLSIAQLNSLSTKLLFPHYKKIEGLQGNIFGTPQSYSVNLYIIFLRYFVAPQALWSS